MKSRSKSSLLYILFDFYDYSAKVVTQTGKRNTSVLDAYFYGEVLRERRKSLGITQKELAERVGRDRTYINRIEKGETDLQLSSFIRIADALGIALRLDVNLV